MQKLLHEVVFFFLLPAFGLVDHNGPFSPSNLEISKFVLIVFTVAVSRYIILNLS